MLLHQRLKLYGVLKMASGSKILETILFSSFFYNKLKVDTILSSEPWSFDKHLMVLQCYDKDTLVKEMLFNKVSFYV